jgi:hypothetical protein
MRRFNLLDESGAVRGEGVQWSDGHVDTSGPSYFADASTAAHWLAGDGLRIDWLDPEPIATPADEAHRA